MIGNNNSQRRLVFFFPEKKTELVHWFSFSFLSKIIKVIIFISMSVKTIPHIIPHRKNQSYIYFSNNATMFFVFCEKIVSETSLVFPGSFSIVTSIWRL